MTNDPAQARAVVPTRRTALVTGANQGMGKQIARELVADGVAVFLGARDLVRGKEAAAEIGDGATPLQLDVTDPVSVASAARRLHDEVGHLDLLVNNAAISTTRTDLEGMADLMAASAASVVPLDEVRAVWEVNVLGPLAVYQAVLPLLRESPAARIINVSSAVGSLTIAAEPTSASRAVFGPSYAASKTALNAVTLAMAIELETSDITVNLVSPGFANTALVNFEGTESVEDAVREVLRVARLGPHEPSGTFTTWEGVPLPW